MEILRNTKILTGAALAAFVLAGCGANGSNDVDAQLPPAPVSEPVPFDHSDPHSIKEHLAHLKDDTYTYLDDQDEYGRHKILRFCVGKTLVKITEYNYVPNGRNQADSADFTYKFKGFADCADDEILNSSNTRPKPRLPKSRPLSPQPFWLPSPAQS